MPKYIPKDGDVSIFPNDKRGNDKAPDHRGTFILDGVEHEIALWSRMSGKGPFLSGKVKVKEYVSPRTGASRETNANQTGYASKTQWGGPNEIDPNPKPRRGWVEEVEDDTSIPF